jgi:hypothetical protein
MSKYDRIYFHRIFIDGKYLYTSVYKLQRLDASGMIRRIRVNHQYYWDGEMDTYDFTEKELKQICDYLYNINYKQMTKAVNKQIRK